jgi:hypothetical protein
VFSSAYGEGGFLAIQTSLVAFFILYYSQSGAGAFGFLAAYAAVMAYLMSPAAPLPMLEAFQTINIGIIVISKVRSWSRSQSGQVMVRSGHGLSHGPRRPLPMLEAINIGIIVISKVRSR